MDHVSSQTSGTSAPSRALVRSGRDHVLTGTAGGIGERLGIDPTVVRLAFVALSLAAGIGVLLYMIAYLLSVQPDPAAMPTALRTSARRAAAIGLIVIGALLLLRAAGLWFGDGLVWPTVFVAMGSAVIWTRGDESDRRRWTRIVLRLPEGSRDVVSGTGQSVRLVVGGLLILAGLGEFLVTNGPTNVRANAPLAAVATLVGVAVIAGPWLWRTAHQLTEERRQRIRSQERAEVAAHLHDSVLQTLALIQRSGEPREMAILARAQERELRSWLYGGARATDQSLLSTAMNDAAAEVERTQRVEIDVVTVGDRRMDEPANAVTLAAREAMVNAAVHAGVQHVSVYVETTEDGTTCYVRDQGAGFDPARTPPDRRGIADSIEGRMARFGGTSSIDSVAGDGTEVRLWIPRATA